MREQEALPRAQMISLVRGQDDQAYKNLVPQPRRQVAQDSCSILRGIALRPRTRFFSHEVED